MIEFSYNEGVTFLRVTPFFYIKKLYLTICQK